VGAEEKRESGASFVHFFRGPVWSLKWMVFAKNGSKESDGNGREWRGKDVAAIGEAISTAAAASKGGEAGRETREQELRKSKKAKAKTNQRTRGSARQRGGRQTQQRGRKRTADDAPSRQQKDESRGQTANGQTIKSRNKRQRRINNNKTNGCITPSRPLRRRAPLPWYGL
jgi:hypothetical protein